MPQLRYDKTEFSIAAGEEPNYGVEYGTEDDDFACVPMLQALTCENLEIITVEGADPEFKGMVNEFITLIDLIQRKG